jgi:monothiol glutaredoxin
MTASAVTPPREPQARAVVVFAIGPDFEHASTREMMDRCRRHGAEPLILDATEDPLFAEHLKDPRLREHFPLLCVRGGLVGGLEVVRQLDAKRQLRGILLPPRADAIPAIALSREAASQLRCALTAPEHRIRIVVTTGFEHDLLVDSSHEGDLELALGDIPVVLDADSASRADGLAIDWVETDGSRAFRISNPNRPDPVHMVDRAWLEHEGSCLHPLIIDVRTAAEYARDHIAEAKLLDATLIDALETLDRRTPLLFYCNGGVRSKKAAERYHDLGFERVYCLDEG